MAAERTFYSSLSLVVVAIEALGLGVRNLV
jgi:hypothetical protein